ncbi:MAG: arginase family protein [Desulfovibrionaceae bacterium]|nr:arginase family protein [Desulfovibrionaceae bacterium]
MKTIRLLYPDYASGGLETYYFGANLLRHILPENTNQKVVCVDVTPPDGQEKRIVDGIYGKEEVLSGIASAQKKLAEEAPDRVITIGGNCLVSLAPFDYLHGLYENLGILWIDAHPDVSTVEDGYPNAHAMVLGSLLGYGAECLKDMMQNAVFKPKDVLYVGLQGLHDYQEKFLDAVGVPYSVQIDEFVSNDAVLSFVRQFEHIAIHFDIDVLDERFFHSTYFANPELVGDGSGGGIMTMDALGDLLQLVLRAADVVGFTIAEYLPFDEHKLHSMLAKLPLFVQ